MQVEKTSANHMIPALTQREQPLKIAVIGTGIAGLSAAWLLDQRHQVTVYEQNDYVGGHSNTADASVAGQDISVDTGFIVYNPVNYPNLVALFEHLAVPTIRSDMSFAASLGNGKIEYSGTNLNGLFAQRRNLLRPQFWTMLRDLRRFYSMAPKLTTDESLAHVSLGDFLQRERFSAAFIDQHLLPMGAAIWSSSVEQMLAFPTLTFLRFFQNHGLLQLNDRPEWRTVNGGSREYVKRLTASFGDRIHCNTPIVSLLREDGRVWLETHQGDRHQYDHVVLACHANQALDILDAPSTAEQQTLSAIPYQPNLAVLHTDTNLMPKRKRAWASWNYIGTPSDGADETLCVTYWMNLLQSLETRDPLLLTLNPCRDIDPAKIIHTYNYEHPIFDRAALAAQSKLWELQGHRNTWFCGAYFGAGFHEDGIQAGLAVAEMLGGAARPWDVPNPSGRVGLGSADLTARPGVLQAA